EFDVPIEMVPLFPFSNERKHLVVQIDHVVPRNLLVLLRSHSVTRIDDIYILFDNPVQGCDETFIVEIGEVVERKRTSGFTNVDALESLVCREINEGHAVGVIRTNVIENRVLPAKS